MKKTFYGLGFNAIKIWFVWILITIPSWTYLIIDFSDFILIISIPISIFGIYFCLYNFLRIHFLDDKIKVPSQIAFKSTKVQYKIKITYNEIENIRIINAPFRTNTKGETMKNYRHDGNHVMRFLELKCKNNVIKNIAIWTYSTKQISKIIDEVVKRSDARVMY